MIRRYILPILLILAFSLAIFFLCLNSNFFLSGYINKVLGQYFDNAVLLSLKSERQYYKHPDMLVLKDVKATFQQGADVFQLDADEVIFYDIVEFAKHKAKLRVNTKNLNAYARDMAWRSLDLNANLEFKGQRLSSLHGIFRNMVFSKKPYDFYDVSGKILVNENSFEAIELTGSNDVPSTKGVL